MVKKITRAEACQLIQRMDTFFFDCDGVLWNGYGVIPGAVELIEKLHLLKKRIFFVTNNSTKSREQLAKSFVTHGFKVNNDELLGTAYLAAMYLKNNIKLGKKKVYMIGSAGMTKEFDEAGINYIGFGPQPPGNDPNIHYSLNYDISRDPDVGAVVVGFDEHFNLNKVSQAMQYLQDDSIPFIATNTDNKYPVGGGLFTPGTGCLVSAVQTAASREPMVIGKPHTLLFEIAKSMYDINPERTMMTGDRLNTDILFGKNCGIKTLCVLSGVTSNKDIEEVKENGSSNLLPDFVADSVLDLSSSFERI